MKKTNRVSLDSGEDAIDTPDLETCLRRAIEHDGPFASPFVALGQPMAAADDTRRPEVYEGAARLFASDADWQGRALRLMDAADRIVMLPLDRPSTSWELEQLVGERLLLVMPGVGSPCADRPVSGSAP